MESKEEWLRRRLIKIFERKKEQGKKVMTIDVKKEIRLKPNTYKRYKHFIDKIVEQLNGELVI